MTPEEAQAGLDALKAQIALLRMQLARLDELVNALTAERAAEMADARIPLDIVARP